MIRSERKNSLRHLVSSKAAGHHTPTQQSCARENLWPFFNPLLLPFLPFFGGFDSVYSYLKIAESKLIVVAGKAFKRKEEILPVLRYQGAGGGHTHQHLSFVLGIQGGILISNSCCLCLISERQIISTIVAARTSNDISEDTIIQVGKGERYINPQQLRQGCR